MNTTKRSKQSEAILEVLRNTKEHPSADTIYSEVRKTIPNISLGTVYRNLSKLTDDKIIQRLDVGLSTERFDGNVAPHYHVICACCGKVMDIESDPPEYLNEWASDRFDGEIFGHSLVFFGKCPNCKCIKN